jgi:chromosome segregation protein
MIGGSKDKLSGILQKKQEIKNLEREIAELESGLEQGRIRQTELEEDARLLETALQQTIAKRTQVHQEEMEAEKDLYRLTEELKHARRHLEIVQLEQEQVLGEESDMDDEISRYNDVLVRVANDVSEAQQMVSVTTGEIDSVSKTVEAFNQRAVDVKLSLTTLNARYDNSRQTYRRLKDFQEDGVQRLTQLTEEVAQKSRRQAVARENVTEYDRQLPVLYEKVKQLEDSLETREADFHGIDKRLQESDAIIAQIKGEREETLEKIRYVELDQSERRMKQENVVRRIAEKYHHGLDALRQELVSEESDEDPGIDVVEKNIGDLRDKISWIGDVNLGAINEFNELKTRYDFLVEQREDLHKALEDLQKVIRKINRITQDRFMKTFHLVNEKLNEVFPRLFVGGSAKLVLTEPDNPLETGVDLLIHPPGKKLTRLSLMSGGEKALSAIAFIFAIFLIKPASFCLMDEIDAPLDEANVYRFNELLKIIGEKSQIVMITHNKKTMEFADVLFGVTMEKKGVSKIVSVDFERAH